MQRRKQKATDEKPVQKKVAWLPSYNDRIEILGLSHRSTKAMSDAGITTVQKLLNIKIQVLYGIKNLGKKSIEEILLCQEKLINYGLQKEDHAESPAMPKTDLSGSIENLKLSNRSINALIRNKINTVEKLLNIKDQDIYALKNIGKKSADEIFLARNSLAKNGSRKPAGSSDNRQERLLKIKKAYSAIPASRLSRPLHDYLSAIYGPEAESAVKECEKIIAPVDRVDGLVSLFDDISKDEAACKKFIFILSILSFDAASNLERIFSRICSHQKHQRYLGVLRKRAQGEVLQDIAEVMNMTRERVRQLESKGIKIIRECLSNLPINILSFIDIEHDHEGIITTGELKSYFGGADYFDLFLYTMITKPNWDTYAFCRRLNAFFHQKYLDRLDLLPDKTSGLPAIMENGRKEALLDKLSAGIKLPHKAIALEFGNIYKPSGSIYYRGRLSLTKMYDYVLEVYYPAGIKLFNDKLIDHFKKHVIEVFGKMEFSENNHAVYARIASNAVLCDRGAYIHPNYVKIDKSLIEEISAFIKASPRNTFSFNELFEVFKQKLLSKSNIVNRYFLQGVLNHFLKGQFYFTRDTISKGREKDFTDELEGFIRSKGTVHKSEIFAEFKGVSQIVFSMRVGRNKNIIYLGSGWYTHSDKLNIKSEDYKLKKTIKDSIKEGPISTRKLLETMRKNYPVFLKNNQIDTYGKLYGVLRFMFNEDFTFSRPYIAALGKDGISNKNVIREYLKPHKSITIPELIKLFEERHLKYLSVRKLIKELDDEFLRVSADGLLRVNEDLSGDALKRITALITETIKSQGFLVDRKSVV